MQQSFKSLIPTLRRFAYSLTGSTADADDLVQTTMERILDKGIPAEIEITKWAFKVCRNVWIDEYRARKTRLAAVEKPELQQIHNVEDESQRESKEKLKQVHLAMDNLPSDQRSILSMVALQGMSYKDVSSILKIPVGTVMSRLSRARTTLLDKVNTQQLGDQI
ncbi:RNA polymerase sigma factor [Paraglaciecola aquimarina]|uniref:RNA polymerase sigma factor n=1 Tax=Paraglaciecola algarum TaxID=3050085 RepID=A0ABS9D8Y7_9ALTE|nr:RNA polymerase sigma factor [Paraglaciecola sp. G1-23]MCF2949393.1 RNA polymerase sigma factor [Paraglaciecola sp. G1-23]